MIYFSRHTSAPFLPKCFSGVNLGKTGSFYSTILKEAEASKGDLRGRIRVTTETFPGVREYVPFINGDRLEIVSFQDEVRVFERKMEESYKLIGGFGRTNNPEDKNHVACKNGYLAVHSCQDSIVHVYTSDKKKHIGCYDVAGRIVQLDIVDKCLYISAQEFSTMFHFHRFDLQNSECKQPITTQIISPPLGFGKNHTFHVRNIVQSQLYAQGLGGSSRFVIEPASQGTHQHYLFPNGDHWIKVLNRCGVFDIEKIGKERETIATGIKFPNEIEAYDSTVFFQDDRLIEAQRGLQRIQVHAYDLKSKNQMALFTALNSNSTYQSDFLTTTGKVYYLTLDVGKSGPHFKLKTVEFDKE